MKSQKKLESFIAYCKANPSERFWQALRNWSGNDFIFSVNLPKGAILSDTLPSNSYHDTFNDE